MQIRYLIISLLLINALAHEACSSKRKAIRQMEARMEKADDVREEQKAEEDRMRQEDIKRHNDRQTAKTQKQMKRFQKQADSFNNRYQKDPLWKRWLLFWKKKKN